MADNNNIQEIHPGMVDTIFTGTLGLGMHNAVSAQQQSQVAGAASVIAACAKLLEVGEHQSQKEREPVDEQAEEKTDDEQVEEKSVDEQESAVESDLANGASESIFHAHAAFCTPKPNKLVRLLGMLKPSQTL